MNKKTLPKTSIRSNEGKPAGSHNPTGEQRNKADKELRSNVKLFRQVFSSITELFQTLEVIYNENGLAVDFSYLEVNPATEKIVNKTRAEMVGKRAKEIFGIVEDYWLEALSRVDKTGNPMHLENYSAAVDKYWDVNFFKVEGRPHTVAVLLRDISERKKSEEEVAAVHQRIQNIIDNTPAIVYAFDLEERFILANKALASLLNSTNGQMIGKKRHEFMPKEDAEWHEANDRQAIEAGRSLEFEEHSELNGRSITWLTTKFPLRDIHGKIYAVGGISSDISERKRLESDLKKYNQTLEESVRSRTEELKRQQENLEEVNRNLLRSNKELESFAYIASHDLQEPLRTVTSFTQLLSMKYKDQLDDDAKEYIQFAVDGAKNMYELINGLLAYSRINMKELTFSKVDANKIIDQVRANLSVIIKNRNCLIEANGLPEICADNNQMIQLFQNLIANGIKFCTGHPLIQISSKIEKTHYHFYVKDNGIGIEPRYFDKIFEIFKRLMPKDQYEGTGIGLAICKRIVENHKGTIWVESEPGKGSVFHFTIPKDACI